MKTPRLETASLVLQPQFHATQQMVGWLSDPQNLVYSEQRHRKHTLAKQQAYVRSFDHTTSHFWLIRRGDEAVGTVTAYRDVRNLVAEMGILIDHRWWGKGFGQQAWSAVMNYLLIDMRKVEAGTRSDNLGMRKVMERCGMMFEGERLHHFVVEALGGANKTAGLVMYGRLR